jgi:hypothetical protein
MDDRQQQELWTIVCGLLPNLFLNPFLKLGGVFLADTYFGFGEVQEFEGNFAFERRFKT